MIQWLYKLLTAVCVSLFFFPVEFRILPGLNTKMILAALGLLLLLIDFAKERRAILTSESLISFGLAMLVSLVGLVSIVYNNTSDYSYSTYFISMSVWFAGAYSTTRIIKQVHGYVNVRLIVLYLSAVCTFQCISALVIDNIPAVKSVVDSTLFGFGFATIYDVNKLGRLYGLGATLDVAATRFASVLIMIALVLRKEDFTKRRIEAWLLVCAFIIISIIGNMIGRTTTIGMIIALLYWIVTSQVRMDKSEEVTRIPALKYLSIILVVTIPILASLYNNNSVFRENIRFGFEGFFSLIETGEWHTDSNERLANMYVWPDNSKTWIIGDGYFQGASNDMNFVGDSKMKSFYMWTDVGYCRFIFYFGILGLILFSVFIISCGVACTKKAPDHSLMFCILVSLNFIIWLKVSTDIFLVFALFMSLKKDELMTDNLEI